jgi:hypothetical protein
MGFVVSYNEFTVRMLAKLPDCEVQHGRFV